MDEFPHPLATKTLEEYRTMAMLLGRTYVRPCHAFMLYTGQRVGLDDYIDADSLLPDGVSTFEDRQARREQWAERWGRAVIGL